MPEETIIDLIIVLGKLVAAAAALSLPRTIIESINEPEDIILPIFFHQIGSNFQSLWTANGYMFSENFMKLKKKSIQFLQKIFNLISKYYLQQ